MSKDLEEATEYFDRMLEAIGVDRAIALQMSVGQKLADSVTSGEPATLDSAESSFMVIFVDYMVQVTADRIIRDVEERSEVHRPGYFGYL